LGKEVEFSFPGGVRSPESVGLGRARVRLGEEEVFSWGRPTSVTPIHGSPLLSEIRRASARELAEGREEFSPEALASFGASLRHEDPFCALAEGRSHVKAEFFLGL